LTSGEKRLLLSVIGALTFASVYATLVMAPVLTQISDEFGVSTGTAGLVAAAYGGPGIVTGLLIGQRSWPPALSCSHSPTHGRHCSLPR
jgi:predicted MFS family arabinose efflux permease